MVNARSRAAAQSRLPSGHPTGSRTAEVVKGLVALVAIGVLVVGVPVALYAGFGKPWLDGVPTSDWIYTDVTARDVLGILVVVVYLALHTEGIHPSVLSAAVWPRGVSDDVRDMALAATAQWLGVDTSGSPRLTVDDDGRWRLAHRGVRLDWDAFRGLVNHAAEPGADPVADLTTALTLVSGPALGAVPTHRYGWLVYEPLEADMTIVTVAVAHRLAELAAGRGDPIASRNALMARLRAAPACEGLWRDALRLASRFATAADVTAVADDMYAAVRKHGSPRGATAETDALVGELLPGYRRSAA